MRHTISVTFQHTFNTLSRIAGLFSGRGYRIDSISLGQAEEEGLSRMTLTTHGDVQIIEQITKQLNKLVNVIKVVDLTFEPFVERELALIKISAPQAARMEIMQIVNIFRAKIIDISSRSMTVEITGNEDKIKASIGMLKPFGILELARTGAVALRREFQGQT